MPLGEVAVPLELLRDPSLTDGSRVLWCYLRAVRKERKEFTWSELRKATGLRQNVLRHYMSLLRARAWIQVESIRPRRFRCEALWRGSRAFAIPFDLLVDGAVPHGARWVWASVRDLESFDYGTLKVRTGHSRNSLSRYVRVLLERGWLFGSATRTGHHKLFRVRAINPVEENRAAEVADFYEGLRRAKEQRQYSVGQYLLVCMVEQLVDEDVLIENAQVRGMVNPETGGRLQYDLLLPSFKVALEFQGPQHFQVTEKYPDHAAYRAQQQRDEAKRRFSRRCGIGLIEVSASELSFAILSDLLGRHGVPLRSGWQEKSHLCLVIEAEAEKYRKEAASLSRRLKGAAAHGGAAPGQAAAR